jgi:hypothetical protein
MPTIPVTTASHEPAVGRAPNTGQLNSATQSGNVFNSVTDPLTGKCVSEKNVQTIPTLPTRLRIHSVGVPRHASGTPMAFAIGQRISNASPARATATTRQSHCVFKPLAHALMVANDIALANIRT